MSIFIPELLCVDSNGANGAGCFVATDYALIGGLGEETAPT
jgi:hypothetical protein